jgi:hypothetical protein
MNDWWLIREIINNDLSGLLCESKPKCKNSADTTQGSRHDPPKPQAVAENILKKCRTYR